MKRGSQDGSKQKLIGMLNIRLLQKDTDPMLIFPAHNATHNVQYNPQCTTQRIMQKLVIFSLRTID